jgi:hypothetical protein
LIDYSFLKNLGDKEIAEGDYVTLERNIIGRNADETIMTFSGIRIKRMVPLAFNATPLSQK